MTTDAGDYLTPPRLNPVAFQLQLASQYTLTGVNTDLTLTAGTPAWPGLAGQTYTVPEGGMVGLAVWTGDFSIITGGALTSATVDLVIDGVAVSAATPVPGPQAIWDPGNTTDGRVTAAASWPLLLAAGAHTFGLRAQAVFTTGSYRLNARHTNVSILLHP